MTASRAQSDWGSVRQRSTPQQEQVGCSELLDRHYLAEVFRKRAHDLEHRGRLETSLALRVPVAVCRSGKERFGIPLADLEQVFHRVPITPMPGKRDLLIGIANVSGTLRSVVDLNTLLHIPAARSEGHYVVLLRIAAQSLALRLESIEGVCNVDFTRLTAVHEVESGELGALIRGVTDDRVLVLDTAALIACVTEQLCGGNVKPLSVAL